jgi:RNA polymerase sigma-70 factor (ECF subfamily)
MTSETLEKLIEAYQTELFFFVKYLGADAVTAEEVVHDTFIAAYYNKKTPDIVDTKKCISWLRGIARNKFLKNCRNKKKDKLEFNSDIMEQAEAYWATQFDPSYNEGNEYMTALNSCLEKIPDKQRLIVNLRYSEQNSRESMAEQLNMTEDGVKSALRRIRSALADCVKASMQEKSHE